MRRFQFGIFLVELWLACGNVCKEERARSAVSSSSHQVLAGASAGVSHMQLTSRFDNVRCDCDASYIELTSATSLDSAPSCELFCLDNGCPCLSPWAQRCTLKSCAACPECTGGTTASATVTATTSVPAATTASITTTILTSTPSATVIATTTLSPTTIGTTGGGPTGPICDFPVGSNGELVTDFSLITKAGASVGAHDSYKGFAIGGNLLDSTAQQSGNVCSHYDASKKLPSGNKCRSWVGALQGSSSWNWKGAGLLEGQGIPFEWADLEDVAASMKAGVFTKNSFKLVVVNQGGSYSWTDTPAHATYNTYDFRNGGQGEDNGATLVVFKGAGTVHLTKTSDGRQFGPSVFAPFARVVVKADAGFVDGFIVAKSFGNVGNTGQLQLHGDGYRGPLCP